MFWTFAPTRFWSVNPKAQFAPPPRTVLLTKLFVEPPSEAFKQPPPEEMVSETPAVQTLLNTLNVPVIPGLVLPDSMKSPPVAQDGEQVLQVP